MKKFIIVILIQMVVIMASKSLFSEPIRFCTVVGDQVNLRENPDVKSKSIAKLLIGEFVTVVDRNKEKVKIGDIEGCWVYVETNRAVSGKANSGCFQGWMLDYYLLYSGEQFPYKGSQLIKRIKLKDNVFVINWEGDEASRIKYAINVDGTIKITVMKDQVEKYTDEKGKKRSRIIWKDGDVTYGKIYKYKSLFIGVGEPYWFKGYIDDNKFRIVKSVDYTSEPESLELRVSDFLCKQPLITMAPCLQNILQTGSMPAPNSLSA